MQFCHGLHVLLYACGFNLLAPRSTPLHVCICIQIDKVSFPGPHYIEDLEDMMYDTMSESFNADFEDGSVEEVIISSPFMFSNSHKLLT